ncbi:MAG: class I SAM-dependent methyltransferase [Gemmataceae bacterium]
MQQIEAKPATAPLPLEGRRVLHLGAGQKYDPRAVNVDLVASTGPDLVHDLDRTPWPLPDGRFEEVWAYDVLEHLDDLIAVMEEIHRVCRPGAVVKVTVPHFSSSNAFTDITHRHYFGRFSFDYFTGENEFAFYSAARYRRREARIVFRPTLFNKLMWRAANRWPAWYEQRWTWVCPAWFLYFELEVVKGEARP